MTRRRRRSINLRNALAPDWSSTEEEMLRQALVEGATMGAIAKKIPGKTRGAIAGKISRLGLTRGKRTAA